MIGTILLLGLALALDSFAVSAGIGATGVSRSRHLGVALGFGICDGLASLLGGSLGFGRDVTPGQWFLWIGPLAVIAYALYVFLLAQLTSSAGNTTGAPWLTFGLPLCLSLDNLLTAGGFNASGLPAPVAATLLGLSSGLLAFAGLRLGGCGAARWPRRARHAGVLGLSLLAMIIAIFK
jgi:putative Mn2+ efflux pump MntP